MATEDILDEGPLLNLARTCDTIAKLTTVPARLLGVPGGTLAPGAPADITVIDPSETWTVDALAFRSRSRNTPFHGWTLKGRAVLTVMGGRITHRS